MTAEAMARGWTHSPLRKGSLHGTARKLLAALAGHATTEDREPAEPVQIRLLRRRDPDAWHALYSDEMRAIYRYARARVGSATDAEDLTARVFEEAWKHAESLEDRGLPPRAWLFGIARHVVASHRRHWLRKPPHLSIEGFDAAGDESRPSPELLDVARAIRQLPAKQAEVVTLRFLHGLSLQETAAVVGASVDAIKGRQARALAELRRMLAVDVEPDAISRPRGADSSEIGQHRGP